LIGDPKLEPVLAELAELVNFPVDNIIYELEDPEQPLMRILPSYDNFLVMLAMWPDTDHRDMLLLTEIHRINLRARRVAAVMAEHRFERTVEKFDR